MCLISVALQCSNEYPFVFVGNRDEYHARDSAPAAWWDDAPDVLGGRDRVAGGSWLGINRTGDFAVVTNRPDLPAPTDNALSRGALVADRLLGKAAAGLDAELDGNHLRYGGFSLLTGNIHPDSGDTTRCLSGGNGSDALAELPLPKRIFGLSNTALNDPWPKLTWLNTELQSLARSDELGDTEQLFALLLRRTPVPGADTDWVSALPFIAGAEYGTRCATVITVNRNGECHFAERRYGPEGTHDGESVFEFSLTPP